MLSMDGVDRLRKLASSDIQNIKNVITELEMMMSDETADEKMAIINYLDLLSRAFDELRDEVDQIYIDYEI